MAKKTRNTKQKEIILKQIGEIKSFFTAEDIYGKVSSIDKGLGIATVYRFLKDLKKEEKLHSYSCNRKTIYSIDDKNHSHFICEKCNKTIHLDLQSIDFFKSRIKGEVCHFQLDVYGICEECSKKKK
ncbi:MAG TPA: transcriptional repressor [Candidatus Nanoarchaeia archaeon]|nr:transcriptional repressor [Candidatus Nanoarchaeia archaeon]